MRYEKTLATNTEVLDLKKYIEHVLYFGSKIIRISRKICKNQETIIEIILHESGNAKIK